jgi:hypothetical protein
MPQFAGSWAWHSASIGLTLLFHKTGRLSKISERSPLSFYFLDIPIEPLSVTVSLESEETDSPREVQSMTFSKHLTNASRSLSCQNRKDLLFLCGRHGNMVMLYLDKKKSHKNMAAKLLYIWSHLKKEKQLYIPTSLYIHT